VVFELSDAISPHYIDAENASIMRKMCGNDNFSKICQKMYKFCIISRKFSQKFKFFSNFQKIKFFFKFSKNKISKNKNFQKKIQKFKKSILTDNLTRFIADNLEKHLLALLSVFTFYQYFT
jgi:hypothetical protein